jgi:pimeloyl-ACP methyl ester carboxylesterase
MWRGQVKYFEKDYRVITYDNRGFGKSESEGNYTMDSHADDAIEILEHLKIDKAAICGLSMGGYITLRTLEKAPGKFSAAFLCDTRSEADTNEAKLKRAQQIKQIKSGDRNAFVKTFIENGVGSSSLKNSAMMNEVNGIIAEQSDFSICTALMTMAARADKTTFLDKLDIPVLIVVGAEDKLTPPENSISMNKHIPGSELVTIPGAGHFTNIETPEAFNSAISEFLKKH